MDKLIFKTKDEDIILDANIYECIEAYYKYNNEFIICHVTEEEFTLMCKQIENYGLKERLSQIDNVNLGYDKSRYMIANNYKNNYIALSDYNNPKKLGSYIINENGIFFDKNLEQFPNLPESKRIINGLKIYTTKSYEEIIKHYLDLKKQKEICKTSLTEIITKVIDSPAEFYKKICNELTIEEREYLKSIIENKTCKNCSNMSCRVETYEKIADDIPCLYWDNQELIGKYKILQKNNK